MKTHCKWGHELVAENLTWEFRRGLKIRRCKACVKRRNEEYAAKRWKHSKHQKQIRTESPLSTHPAVLLFREELAKRPHLLRAS